MIPAREALREAYDAVIAEMNGSRGSQQLTNAFYAKIGDAIFHAGYGALEDTEATKGDLPHTPRLRVVPAPMGSGKTSFSQALIAAIVRLGDDDPRLSCGCVFVVKERQAADNIYRSLSKLLPGRVAIWTTDHDAKSTKPPEVVQEPAARYHQDDLQHYPVAIVTHAFFKGKNGHKAQSFARSDVLKPRLLTIIDEQPEDVRVFDMTLTEATAVWEAVQCDERRGEFISHKLGPLVAFMVAKELGGSSLEKLSGVSAHWTERTD